MKQILQDWLHSMALIIDIDYINDYLKDCTLLIKLLKNYNIINPLYVEHIAQSENYSVCLNNLRQLKCVFDMLHVQFDEEIIRGVAGGEMTACITLLTQLYIRLEDKDTLPFVHQQDGRTVHRGMYRSKDFRFVINKVEESELLATYKQIQTNRYDYNTRIKEHGNVIDWCRNTRCQNQKKKLKSLNESRAEKLARHEIERCGTGNVKLDIFKSLLTCSPHIQPGCSFVGNRLYVCETPAEFVSKLKDAAVRDAPDKNFRKQFEVLIFNDIWDSILEKEEENYNNLFSDKLLRQSKFEEQMMIKLLQILHQDSVHRESYKNIRKKVDAFLEYKLEAARETVDSLDLVYYEKEKKRTIDLHKKLYAEKLQKRFERHYAICYETLEDMLELAVRLSEYKHLFKIPLSQKLWNEWKSLFIHSQPVQEFTENIEILLNDFMLGKEFPLNKLEWNRQDALNEHNLEDYLFTNEEWSFNKIWVERLEETVKEQLVLGYVVHTLLETKYPLPPLPEPADIPKYPLTSILINMDDDNAVIKLKNLLSKPGVLVVDVNSAINYCIQSYKDVESKFNFDLNARETINGIHSTKPSMEDEQALNYVAADNDAVSDNDAASPIQTKDKSVQTGTENFSEPNEIGKAARIGEVLFSNMMYGSEIDTNLIVAAIIELIKSRKKIKGWILVNFPSTLYQASILELALTGKKFPYQLGDDTGLDDRGGSSGQKSISRADVYSSFKESCIDFKHSNSNNNYNYDEGKTSRLVPNPRKCNDDDAFKTYLTQIIVMRKGVKYPPSFSSDLQRSLTHKVSSYNNSSNSTLLLEYPEREGIPTLFTFYEEQNILYDFVYDSLDLATLKHLARLLLGTMHSEPVNLVSSFELFGEFILKQLQQRGSVIANYDKIHRDSSQLMGAGIAESESTVSELVESFSLDNSNDYTPTVIKPGEKGWLYADIPILYNVSICLASYWEVLESTYISNLKDVFFLIRSCEACVVPYIHYLKMIMRTCFVRGDNRQDVVTEFLNAYNGIHQVLRSDEEMKCELHLRVTELQTDLLRLCEDKKNNAEYMRQHLLNQNWIADEMALFTNAMISMLQIEVDRCTKTLQLVQDYYLSMIQKFKSDDLSTITLAKISMRDESKESLSHELNSEMIMRLNCYPDNVVDTVNPYCTIIARQVEIAAHAINEMRSFSEGLISSEETKQLVLLKQKIEGEEKELREMKQKLKKEREKKRKDKKGSPKLEEEEEIELGVTTNQEEEENKLRNLFLEWKVAAASEVERALFRVELINRKACSDLMELENLMGTTFGEFQAEEGKIYKKEAECIRKLCKLFGTAIEERTPVYGFIVFEQDLFYVEKVPVEIKAPILKMPPALNEDESNLLLTIRQLDILCDQLSKVSPSGIIGTQAFIVLIEDMIATETEETGHFGIFEKLSFINLVQLFHIMFGNTGMIDWRDFMIFCLDLPYPLMEEIVDAKLQFLAYDPYGLETVSYDSYMKITLWFHRELPTNPSEALRNVLAKDFLFRLFGTQKKRSIHYSALLLAFCKDTDERIGFGKALAFLMCRCVIVYDQDIYLQSIMTDHILTAQKIVSVLINELVTAVVDTMSVNNIMEGELIEYDIEEVDALFSPSEYEHSSMYYMDNQYDQFIRRYKVLNWTAEVPLTLLNALLITTYFPQVSPSSVTPILSSNYIDEELASILQCSDSNSLVYCPKILDYIFNINFFALPRFKAFSIPQVINYILNDLTEHTQLRQMYVNVRQ